MAEGSASQTPGAEKVGAASRPRRALALDALRGLAILGMVLSGDVPEDAFPAWMYHAQNPPGQHFNRGIAGLTWVDLVFPFFIFSMGAAISLALSRRREQGRSYWSISGGIVYRTFLLGAFAIYVAHIRPHALSADPTAATWALALLGFVLLFPILARLPDSWPLWLRLLIRGVGWAGAIAMMSSVQFTSGHHHHGGGGGLTGFSVERSDIIIVLLTNVALFGSFLWLLSQGNMMLRLGFLGFLMAARLSAESAGWIAWLDGHWPLPWMFELDYLQWLFIAIPGTIVGDRILAWMRSTKGDSAETGWSVVRTFGLATLMVSFVLIVLIGMQSRWLWPTTVVVAAMCLLGYWLVRGPSTGTERLVRDLYPWGVYWLLLGLAFEPFEGGIKKTPDTMSYYLVTAGLAIFLLIAGTIVIDIWRRQRWLQLLIDNGQNPMIAYVGGENFIWPIVILTRLDRPIGAITQAPWAGLTAGVLTTLVVAYAVRVFTRLRIFWRT